MHYSTVVTASTTQLLTNPTDDFPYHLSSLLLCMLSLGYCPCFACLALPCLAFFFLHVYFLVYHFIALGISES